MPPRMQLDRCKSAQDKAQLIVTKTKSTRLNWVAALGPDEFSEVLYSQANNRESWSFLLGTLDSLILGQTEREHSLKKALKIPLVSAVQFLSEKSVKIVIDHITENRIDQDILFQYCCSPAISVGSNKIGIKSFKNKYPLLFKRLINHIEDSHCQAIWNELLLKSRPDLKLISNAFSEVNSKYRLASLFPLLFGNDDPTLRSQIIAKLDRNLLLEAWLTRSHPHLVEALREILSHLSEGQSILFLLNFEAIPFPQHIPFIATDELAKKISYESFITEFNQEKEIQNEFAKYAKGLSHLLRIKGYPTANLSLQENRICSLLVESLRILEAQDQNQATDLAKQFFPCASPDLWISCWDRQSFFQRRVLINTYPEYIATRFKGISLSSNEATFFLRIGEGAQLAGILDTLGSCKETQPLWGNLFGQLFMSPEKGLQSASICSVNLSNLEQVRGSLRLGLQDKDRRRFILTCIRPSTLLPFFEGLSLQEQQLAIEETLTMVAIDQKDGKPLINLPHVQDGKQLLYFLLYSFTFNMFKELFERLKAGRIPNVRGWAQESLSQDLDLLFSSEAVIQVQREKLVWLEEGKTDKEILSTPPNKLLDQYKKCQGLKVTLQRYIELKGLDSKVPCASIDDPTIFAILCADPGFLNGVAASLETLDKEKLIAAAPLLVGELGETHFRSLVERLPISPIFLCQSMMPKGRFQAFLSLAQEVLDKRQTKLLADIRRVCQPGFCFYNSEEINQRITSQRGDLKLLLEKASKVIQVDRMNPLLEALREEEGLIAQYRLCSKMDVEEQVRKVGVIQNLVEAQFPGVPSCLTLRSLFLQEVLKFSDKLERGKEQEFIELIESFINYKIKFVKFQKNLEKLNVPPLPSGLKILGNDPTLLGQSCRKGREVAEVGGAVQRLIALYGQLQNLYKSAYSFLIRPLRKKLAEVKGELPNQLVDLKKELRKFDLMFKALSLAFSQFSNISKLFRFDNREAIEQFSDHLNHQIAILATRIRQLQLDMSLLFRSIKLMTGDLAFMSHGILIGEYFDQLKSEEAYPAFLQQWQEGTIPSGYLQAKLQGFEEWRNSPLARESREKQLLQLAQTDTAVQSHSPFEGVANELDVIGQWLMKADFCLDLLRQIASELKDLGSCLPSHPFDATIEELVDEIEGPTIEKLAKVKRSPNKSKASKKNPLAPSIGKTLQVATPFNSLFNTALEMGFQVGNSFIAKSTNQETFRGIAFQDMTLHLQSLVASFEGGVQAALEGDLVTLLALLPTAFFDGGLFFEQLMKGEILQAKEDYLHTHSLMKILPNLPKETVIEEKDQTHLEELDRVIIWARYPYEEKHHLAKGLETIRWANKAFTTLAQGKTLTTGSFEKLSVVLSDWEKMTRRCLDLYLLSLKQKVGYISEDQLRDVSSQLQLNPLPPFPEVLPLIEGGGSSWTEELQSLATFDHPNVDIRKALNNAHYHLLHLIPAEKIEGKHSVLKGVGLRNWIIHQQFLHENLLKARIMYEGIGEFWGHNLKAGIEILDPEHPYKEVFNALDIGSGGHYMAYHDLVDRHPTSTLIYSTYMETINGEEGSRKTKSFISSLEDNSARLISYQLQQLKCA